MEITSRIVALAAEFNKLLKITKMVISFADGLSKPFILRVIPGEVASVLFLPVEKYSLQLAIMNEDTPTQFSTHHLWLLTITIESHID